MARRQFEGLLTKWIREDDLRRQGLLVTDPARIELELREIFENIDFGNPLDDVKAVNFNARFKEVTAPSAVDTETPVAHELGRTPICWIPVAVARSGYRFLGSLYATKDPDDAYLYVAVADGTETSKKGFVLVW